MNNLLNSAVLILLISILSSCNNWKNSQDSAPLIVNGRNPFTQSVAGSDQAVWVSELVIEKNHLIATCTGTLFDYKGAEYILSAAHCFIDKQGKVVSPSAVTVVFYDPKTDQESSYQVSQLSVNALYDRDILWTPTSFKQRDLAILKLSKKVDQRISRQLPILALTSQALRSLDIPGGDFAFYGFGLTNGGDLSAGLLFGRAKARSADECVAFIGGSAVPEEQPRLLSPQGPIGIFCSLAPESGAYSASGDSGGPAIVYQNNKSYIVGVLASGSASPKNPSKLIDSVFETLDDSKTIEWLDKFTSSPKRRGGCLPFK